MTVEEMTAFTTPVAMIILIVMQRRDAAKAAAKVETVKSDLKNSESNLKITLAESAQKRDAKLGEIHDLVNSEMSKALAKIDKQRKEITQGLNIIRELHKELAEARERRK